MTATKKIPEETADLPVLFKPDFFDGDFLDGFSGAVKDARFFRVTSSGEGEVNFGFFSEAFLAMEPNMELRVFDLGLGI